MRYRDLESLCGVLVVYVGAFAWRVRSWLSTAVVAVSASGNMPGRRKISKKRAQPPKHSTPPRHTRAKLHGGETGSSMFRAPKGKLVEA